MSDVIGAIVGDIVGSRFEFDNYRAKDFDLFAHDCYATDDSIMTLAVAKALVDSDGDMEKLKAIIVPTMQKVGRPYPYCGYGGHFYDWIYSKNPKPYNSYGNGAAMRVSPVAYAAEKMKAAKTEKIGDVLKKLSHIVTAVSHDHPEGLKGAEATAMATYVAMDKDVDKSIWEKQVIRAMMDVGYYKVDFKIAEVRPTYQFDETCQKTLPVALAAFYESTGFEDAIRNAVSVGGDSDTIAAITGAIAGAYYGVPEDLKKEALTFLSPELLNIYRTFENWAD